MGKDGWLFLCNDSNGCIEQYTGKIRLSPQLLREYADYYRKIQEYFRHEGIHYLLNIVPGKEYIYPEFLPDSVIASNLPTVSDQFITAINPELDENIIDIKPILLANKLRGQLYLKNDSHWNYLGAMIASKVIVQKLIEKFSYAPQFNESKFTLIECEEGAGDLSMKTYLDFVNEKYIESSIQMVRGPSICAFSVKYEIRAKEIVDHAYKNLSKTRPTKLFRNEAVGHLPRAIILRGSSADWMIPFLSEHFSECLFIWARNVNKDVIASFKPQIFIELVADRFLMVNREKQPFQ